MEKHVLKVDGMSCAHCKKSVEQALKTLDGVKEATVDLASKNVAIEYDPQAVSIDQIKGAIEEAGYDVMG